MAICEFDFLVVLGYDDLLDLVMWLFCWWQQWWIFLVEGLLDFVSGDGVMMVLLVAVVAR